MPRERERVTLRPYFVLGAGVSVEDGAGYRLGRLASGPVLVRGAAYFAGADGYAANANIIDQVSALDLDDGYLVLSGLTAGGADLETIRGDNDLLGGAAGSGVWVGITPAGDADQLVVACEVVSPFVEATGIEGGPGLIGGPDAKVWVAGVRAVVMVNPDDLSTIGPGADSVTGQSAALQVRVGTPPPASITPPFADRRVWAEVASAESAPSPPGVISLGTSGDSASVAEALTTLRSAEGEQPPDADARLALSMPYSSAVAGLDWNLYGLRAEVRGRTYSIVSVETTADRRRMTLRAAHTVRRWPFVD